MKFLKIIITLFLMSLIGQGWSQAPTEVIKVYHTSQELGFRLPGSLQTSSNWLSTYKRILGNEISSTWLAEQMAQGNLMLTSEDEQQLYLLIKSEANSQRDLADEMEEGFIGRSQDGLQLFSKLKWLDSERVSASFLGALGGRRVFAQAQGFFSPMGSLILLTIIPNQPVMDPAGFVPDLVLISSNISNK